MSPKKSLLERSLSLEALMVNRPVMLIPFAENVHSGSGAIVTLKDQANTDSEAKTCCAAISLHTTPGRIPEMQRKRLHNQS